jgi:hypothetical protein
MVIFYDRDQVTPEAIRAVVDHPQLDLTPWPMKGTDYHSPNEDKWSNTQRYKMLAGFVHVPAMVVHTPYWLKLDTDVVATGQSDWIDEQWFTHTPAIVSHRWGFTKPADQMVQLDEWAVANLDKLEGLWHTSPLAMEPKEGSQRLGHKRIISWCGFFNLDFTRLCSRFADDTCGRYQLPVPSQDGFMWYLAKRLGLGIGRVNMKDRGWQQWHTYFNIQFHSMEALDCGK